MCCAGYTQTSLHMSDRLDGIFSLVCNCFELLGRPMHLAFGAGIVTKQQYNLCQQVLVFFEGRYKIYFEILK